MLIHLNQIKDGQYLKQQADRVDQLKTYFDSFTPTTGQTVFNLTKKPEQGLSFINIGGATYLEGQHFTLDRDTGKVTWTFTKANNGFDLGENKVTVFYVSLGGTITRPEPAAPVITQSVKHGQVDLTSSETFSVTYTVTSGSEIADASKITVTPTPATTPTATIVQDQILEVVFPTVAGTEYTIQIAAGAIKKVYTDEAVTKLNEGTVTTTFSTATVVEPAQGWTYEWTQAVGDYGNHELVGHTLTTEDVYGPAYDGQNRKAHLYFLGRVTNPLAEPAEVPLKDIDTYEAPADSAGKFTYDPDVSGKQMIGFESFGLADGKYRLVYTP